MGNAERKLRAVPGGKAPARRGRPSKQASTSDKAPTRRAGRPKSLVASTISEGSSEREMLVVLRAKLAKQLDGEVPTHSLDKLLRQFLNLDARIRSIDARAAEAEDGDDEDADEDVGDGGLDI